MENRSISPYGQGQERLPLSRCHPQSVLHNKRIRKVKKKMRVGRKFQADIKAYSLEAKPVSKR